jgi:hypothetical protein
LDDEFRIRLSQQKVTRRLEIVVQPVEIRQMRVANAGAADAL